MPPAVRGAGYTNCGNAPQWQPYYVCPAWAKSCTDCTTRRGVSVYRLRSIEMQHSAALCSSASSSSFCPCHFDNYGARRCLLITLSTSYSNSGTPNSSTSGSSSMNRNCRLLSTNSLRPMSTSSSLLRRLRSRRSDPLLYNPGSGESNGPQSADIRSRALG